METTASASSVASESSLPNEEQRPEPSSPVDGSSGDPSIGPLAPASSSAESGAGGAAGGQGPDGGASGNGGTSLGGTSSGGAGGRANAGSGGAMPGGAGGEAAGGAEAFGGAAGSEGGAGGGESAGGGEMGGFGGATEVPMPTEGECPSPPESADAQAIEAYEIINELRVAAGAGCAVMVPELNLASDNHCAYYAMNDGQCTSDPHGEVPGCDGFTGESFGQRATEAGYMGSPASEIMAFANDPGRAIGLWVNSVWHRTPILSPWITEFGYGSADGCDTIDWGRGSPLPDETLIVYPYDGQIDVPTTFDGSREGPEPPEPPTGWPSGSPITLYAQDVQVDTHTLTIDGDDAPIEHMWLIPEEHALLRNELFLYSYVPLEPATTYRVRITGSYAGGALNLQWTFRTE